MTSAPTAGYVLADAIMVIGEHFLVTPRTAAAGYRVLPDLDRPAPRPTSASRASGILSVSLEDFRWPLGV